METHDAIPARLPREAGSLTVEAVPIARVPRAELRVLTLLDDDSSLSHEVRVLEAIGATLRRRVEVLLARRRGHLEGALPLVLVRSPWGATDSSVAYLDRGGPIGSPAARETLVRTAARRALERGATLELRSPTPVEIAVAGGEVHVARSKDTLVCPLPSDPEEVARRLDAKTRNQLRKALREGLRSETVAATPESVGAFHEVYSRTMRDLGSPPHALELFLGLARALGERARVARVLDPEERVVAAALLLDDNHGSTVLPWAASDRRADALEPNTLLYHELLWDSAVRGRRELDLGRSTRDGPAFRFKLRWGAEPRPLYWTTFARPGTRAAPRGSDREGKLAWAVAAWKRLPLGVARALGPLVTRWIAA